MQLPATDRVDSLLWCHKMSPNKCNSYLWLSADVLTPVYPLCCPPVVLSPIYWYVSFSSELCIIVGDPTTIDLGASCAQSLVSLPIIVHCSTSVLILSHLSVCSDCLPPSVTISSGILAHHAPNPWFHCQSLYVSPLQSWSCLIWACVLTAFHLV